MPPAEDEPPKLAALLAKVREGHVVVLPRERIDAALALCPDRLRLLTAALPAYP